MKTFISLLLIFPLLAHAEINFITLKHRNAEVLLPMLQPVVDEGIKLSGSGPTLIINSLPWQLTEIRKLVNELDTPLQSLLINVQQGGERERRVLHGDISGNIEQPKVRLYGTDKQKRDNISQQLRVIEGGWATIRVGESIPVIKQSTSQTPYGKTTQQSIEYKDIDSGFEVRPLLRGNRVTLTVRPFRAKRALSGAGIVQHQEMSTTVSGKLNEWISLGGADESQSYSGRGTVYSTGKKQSLTSNVKIKVERLPR